MVRTFHRADPFAEFGLRAVALWAKRDGALVQRVDSDPDYVKAGIDLLVTRGGAVDKAKVRTDSYYGSDRDSIDDHELPYYRKRSDDFALETISHHITREPGWMFNSTATQLWYYQAAVMNSKDELARALSLSDEQMVEAIEVEADRLRILPMPQLRKWFDTAHVNYPPRPVQVGDHLSWYRIIPAADLMKAVPGVITVGRLFGRL